LDGTIGEHHIPKGNLATGTANFNRPNDFVRLSRTPYSNPARIILDFQTARPLINHQNRQWTYVINSVINDIACTNRIKLTFSNKAVYDQIAAQTGPADDPYTVLSAYGDILDIEIASKHAFFVGLNLQKATASIEARFKIETKNQHAELLTGARVSVTLSGSVSITEKNILGDNIRRVRVKKTAGAILKHFAFETYDDFLNTRTNAAWTSVNNELALSVTDTVVFNRLENPAYPIDNLWPQYNEGTKVRIANYQDKWSVPHDGTPSVKQAVERYISLSNTQARAEDVFHKPGADPEDAGVVISYLDALNMAASDFHFARMFGMGYIDALTGANVQDRYIYRVEYINRRNLQTSAVSTFRALSLPTSKADSRVPEKPVLKPVAYQFQDDAGANSTLDEQGYSRLYNARIVSLSRERYPSEISDEDFFDSPTPGKDFNTAEHAEPSLYGIEYRPAGQTAYVKPEITSEGAFGFQHYAYQDGTPQGVLETVPVPDDPVSLYTHFERRSGVHYYAAYGINWFARASALSNEVVTDATQFTPKNNLQTPIDISVQYVQQEDTLLFTTQAEQNWLSGRMAAFPGADTAFTRITFNWLDLTDLPQVENIQDFAPTDVVRADRIDFHFKPREPLQLSGLISDVRPVNGKPSQCIVYTRPAVLIDGALSELVVPAAQLPLFAGSLLNTETSQFVVISVQQGEEGPSFTLEKVADSLSVEDEENANTFAADIRYIQPDLGDRFTVTENLSPAANWNALSAKVSLVDFLRPENPAIESTMDSEGNILYTLVGGITAGAIISPIPAQSPAPVLPGYYQVSFPQGTNLSSHPQVNLPYDPALPQKNNPGSQQTPHVEWYKGLIRVPVTGSTEKKLLEVIRIVSLSPLLLYVYDPNYTEAPITLSDGNQLIQGVNFHPGYRVYIFPEPAGTFNRGSIEPLAGQNTRKTMIGLQSSDTGGSGFSSRVSMPALLMAARIRKPEKPETPLYTGLRVRPNETGRAAFTFDIRVSTTSGPPFGYTFFRANLDDAFYALYKAETVDAINSALKTLTEDSFADQRLYELINLVLNSSGNAFNIFPAEPAPYGFPQPDKTGLVQPGDTQAIRNEKYMAAIRSTLLPLSEQTPILDFIKTGLQTDNKVPRIRNIDGVLLDPGSPDFDPFPMIRKYVNGNMTYVRFTDYSLIASSRNRYFYSAAETTNQLVVGPISTFVGPVSVVQTMPPPAPVLKDYQIDIAGLLSDSPLAINFRINPVSPAEN
ncbi:MAG: hypothetical protein INR69_18220, partial [Mucilaginibacter polytrichastri]|nr:hypothetical protein [Mucilaginibacter polytrichastri]